MAADHHHRDIGTRQCMLEPVELVEDGVSGSHLVA
jgi:hypothetical protein